MSCDVFLDLPNGRMPAIGYGTARCEGDKLETGLQVALETGYRHIDTAQRYGNEQTIGKVLKKWFDNGRLKRKEIFVTTKVSPFIQPDAVDEALELSLRKLQLDYVDLYLIHFPVIIINKDGIDYGSKDVSYMDIWRVLEEQFAVGKAKQIGVSNFNQQQMEHMMKNCRVKPHALQIELHVNMQQTELVDYCNENNIAVVAYAPFGSPGYNDYLKSVGLKPKDTPSLFENPIVQEISVKHSKTPAQILLRYLIQIGVATIPKSATPSRIRENFHVFNFSLDETDMDALLGIDIGPSSRVFDMKPYGVNVLQHPDFPF